jgi:hypothetical protein
LCGRLTEPPPPCFFFVACSECRSHVPDSGGG